MALTAPDLTQRAPRSPRVRLGGYVILARLLDKGPDRPLHGEGDRAFQVAALESVDAVIIFNEPAAIALLARLRPAVYVKGGDYDMGKMAESALVRGWGGHAVALPFVDGFATLSSEAGGSHERSRRNSPASA